jgi:hypothetical protein
MTAVARKAAPAVAIRTDGITRTPSAVVVSVGFVVATNVAHADAAVD